MKPCNVSWIFDTDKLGFDQGQGGTGGKQPLISLCDRVKPGWYTIARGTGITDYAACIGQANGLGMQGIAFLLGDADNPPEALVQPPNKKPDQYIAKRLVFNPDDGPTAQPYQKFQKQMLADQVTDPVPGPGAARAAKLQVGGLFVLGEGGFESPAAAAQTIAAVRNKLNLDFVLIDIDHPAWKQKNANKKALTIAQHVQERYTGMKLANGLPLSSHCPTFFITPKSIDGYDELLTLSAPTDPSNRCFEPVVNGYSGPKTFLSPRVPAGAGVNDLAAAYQWAKPWSIGGGNDATGISRCEFVIDVRNGGDASSTAQLINKKGAGLSVQFSNQHTNWTPWCGMVLFDDLDHFDGVDGDKPDSYWDFDGHSPMEGTLIPVWQNELPPIVLVDQDYENDDKTPVTLGFENWKTGQLDDSNLPTTVFINVVDCSETISPIGSWLRFNGAPIVTGGGPTIPYLHAVQGPNFKFTGRPLKGDDGVYPILMEFRGSQSDRFGSTIENRTQLSLVIEVIDPDLVGDPGNGEPGHLKSSTGIPIMKPDIPERTVSNAGNHPLAPRPASRARVPNDWGTSDLGSDWCKGTIPANPSKPIPRPPHELPSGTEDACGFTIYPDVIFAAWDECSQFGLTPFQICDTWPKEAEYAGFVFTMAGIISGWKTDFDDGNGHYGLWGLSPSSGPGAGSSVDQLKNPIFATNKVIGYLHQAWLDGYNIVGWTCGPTTLGIEPHPYEDRVNHAMLYFADQAGYYPGAHGGDFSILSGSGVHSHDPCFQHAVSGSVPWTGAVAGPAGCFKDFVLGGNLPAPPGVGGPAGGGTSGGGGGPAGGGNSGQKCCPPAGSLNICQMLQLAQSVGFNASNSVSPGGSSAQTIVEIAMAESGGQCCGGDNVNPGAHPSVDRGILQFNSNSPPVPTDAACAYTPECAFAHAFAATGGVNFGAWSTFLSGGCPGHAYCGFIQAVKTASCSDTTGGSGGGGGGGNGPKILGCPVQGVISADCAWHQTMEGILAVDIANIAGTAVYATCDGTLITKDWDARYGTDPPATKYLADCNCLKPPGYGIMAEVQCDDGVHKMRYGHLDRTVLTSGAYPKQGDKVKNGALIAVMDNTGFSSGPHTHYEVFVNDQRVCPIPTLPAGCP